MRVIAGKARSLKLKTPEGLETRPTTDRIKETLFNMLQPYLPDGIFIDLFSGSGGIGIEALSRGARHAYFVENQKNAIACIQENLKFTRLIDDATILKQDVLSALSGIPEKEADVIFMDPPYALSYERQVLDVLQKLPDVWNGKGARKRIQAEHPGKPVYRERRRVSFFWQMVNRDHEKQDKRHR